MKQTQDVSRDAKKLLQASGNSLQAAIAALQGVADEQSVPAPVLQKQQKPAGPVLVSVDGVTKQYKIGRQRVMALNDVSLQIHQGEIVAFTGASGSGKSTLLQLIGGLDKPDTGSVTIDGKSLAKLSDKKLSEFRNKTIGFVFQFFYLQPFLNLQTNLAVPGIFARMRHQDYKERTAELARAVGLSDRLAHLPKELSGGQMQRAAIARALLNRPKLILADEPTGNLDSVNGQAIIELFEKVRTEFNTTIIVVTHDAKIAAQADRKIELRDGRIL